MCPPPARGEWQKPPGALPGSLGFNGPWALPERKGFSKAAINFFPPIN